MFCIHDCGFVAQIALQDVGSKVRLVKLFEMIRSSRYSIHDLSRIQEPRLNMAFECGICIAAKEFGDDVQQTKDMLILDAEDHRYKKTMSDIAGQDAKIHNNDPIKAINCVRTFLARKSGIVPFMGGKAIAERYADFRNHLPAMATAAHLDPLELETFEYLPELISLMIGWQRA